MPKKPSAPSDEVQAFHAAAQSGDVAGVNAYLSSASVAEKIQKKDRAEYLVFTDAMQLAIRAKNPDCMAAMLQAGGFHRENPRGFGFGVDQTANDFILDAIVTGDLGVVKALAPIANLNHKGARFNTPLHLAARGSDAQIVDFFLENGADPAAQDIDGITPLAVAARRGSADSVRSLLKVSDPNVADASRMTPLMHAAQQNNASTVEVLLPVSDLSLRDQDRNSALHFSLDAASYRNDFSAFAQLAKAHPNAGDMRYESDKTFLMAAVEKNNPQAVSVLLPFSNANALGEYSGQTALMKAVLAGASECAALLIPASDVSLQDKAGRTALDLAENRNQQLEENRQRFIRTYGESFARSSIRLPRETPIAQSAMEALRKASGAPHPEATAAGDTLWDVALHAESTQAQAREQKAAPPPATVGRANIAASLAKRAAEKEAATERVAAQQTRKANL